LREDAGTLLQSERVREHSSRRDHGEPTTVFGNKLAESRKGPRRKAESRGFAVTMNHIAGRRTARSFVLRHTLPRPPGSCQSPQRTKD
jgi:hypothetical protein